eukprot:CAMPEP_0172879172 /NCGR_PEP_ID=MMETSP1075-20121228/111782_1 /TAXON_ID=2916 /ORGANISM="Ceratium fusus, Strain PA161109" /LENGTH=37 /DNA_ID= /DNA_START= /DNA_END= /DNA_ORIENTATION=
MSVAEEVGLAGDFLSGGVCGAGLSFLAVLLLSVLFVL